VRSTMSTQAQSRPSVLLVGVDPASQVLIERTIPEQRLIIQSVRCAGEALAEVMHAEPELVVIDEALPDLDSFELCRYLKRDFALEHTRVALLGSDPELTVYRSGWSPDRYFTKPFRVGDVLGLLDEPGLSRLQETA
jgi:CheY-like chemotaxis protein